MRSLSNDLRRVLATHIQSAPASDIIAIASTLCAGESPEQDAACADTLKIGEPRFVAADGIVTDRLTGLMWTQAPVACGRKSHKEAMAAASAVTLGGHTDWGAPCIRQQLSLVDYERNDPAIDPIFECPAAPFWTRTLYKPSPGGYAWDVNFSFGLSNWNDQSLECFVRAVRAGQLIGNWGW